MMQKNEFLTKKRMFEENLFEQEERVIVKKIKCNCKLLGNFIDYKFFNRSKGYLFDFNRVNNLLIYFFKIKRASFKQTIHILLFNYY